MCKLQSEWNFEGSRSDEFESVIQPVQNYNSTSLVQFSMRMFCFGSWTYVKHIALILIGIIIKTNNWFNSHVTYFFKFFLLNFHLPNSIVGRKNFLLHVNVSFKVESKTIEKVEFKTRFY